MEEVRVRGLHRVEVCNRHGNISSAVLELRFKRIHLRPPIGKQAKYPALTLTVLHVTERSNPTGRHRIDWKLLTDLPVMSRTQAIEKLQWYATRWKIETFYKIMKSGCKVEQSKPRTAERLLNLISLYCILSWRIFWTIMTQRAARTAPATLALTRQELNLLDRLVHGPTEQTTGKADLSVYVCKLARLGGYLARSHDPPPGNIVTWRGLSRLTEIELGYELALETMGN